MDTLLKNLTIKNNFMFAAVMSDEENCKGFLERVLPIKVDHVEILKDGRCIVFLNTRGENSKDVPKELVSFLKFVHADLKESQKDFQDDYVRQVQKSVIHIKENREMEERFMLLELLLQDERREGREEGRKEGRKAGELEGAQEMLQMALNRFGELSENLLKTLHQQQDIEVIRKWMETALQAESLDDFISKM